MTEDKSSNVVYVPISLGELCDKYTILQIKSERIQDKEDKIQKVKTEMAFLSPLIEKCQVSDEFLNKLKHINETLWDLEDAIRLKESMKVFDDDFIRLARQIYKCNDHRFEIKSDINAMYQSGISEVKSYAKY